MYINVRTVQDRVLSETSSVFNCTNCIKFKDCKSVQYKTNCILYDILRNQFDNCCMIPYFTTNQPRLIDILHKDKKTLPIALARMDQAKAKCMVREK